MNKEEICKVNNEKNINTIEAVMEEILKTLNSKIADERKTKHSN